MTLSLKNVIRGLLFDGSRRSGNGGGLAHEKSPRFSQQRAIVQPGPYSSSMRRFVFEALGYSVLTANCGEDALEAFAMYSVHAVVLDYLMPGMNGEETARRIRKLHSDIPIILSSGCLTLPERVLEIVTVAVEKAAGPETLIKVLEQHIHPLLDPTSNGKKIRLVQHPVLDL